MLRVCVAVVSRDRPKMVARLVASLQSLSIPPDAEVTLLLVENGDGSVLGGLAEAIRATTAPYRFAFEVEPKLGISSARNHALAYALENGFDRLAFVDDDETVAPAWLVCLLEEMRRSGAQLVGGPVLPLIQARLTWLQSILWRGYSHRCRKVERRAFLRKQRGSDGAIVILTNNWLLDLGFCRSHPIAFDERFNLSGGEDTAFFRLFKRMGGATSWAPEAVVHEEIPATRLSIGYQFARSAGSAATRLSMRSKRGPAGWIEPIALVFVKTIVATIMLILLPISLGATLYGAVRNYGIAAGAALALFGAGSTHYATTTGE